MIRVVRTGETFRDDNGIEGRRSLIYVGPICWHAIERGDGYVHVRPGRYFAEMSSMRSARRRCLRLLPNGHTPESMGSRKLWESINAGRMLIHSANRPSQLKGCIAPGCTITDTGVGNSTKAMDEMFDALGGFDAGRPVRIEVING